MSQFKSPQSPRIVGLSPEDAAAIDAILESSAGSVTPAADPQRQKRASELLDLIGELPAEDPPDDLAKRTVELVQEARLRQSLSISRQSGGSEDTAWSFRWPDLAAIAASLLIAVGLLLPLMSNQRAQARRVACENRLAAAGMGLGSYVADHNGALPRRQTEPGTPWFHVGKEVAEGQPVESNSANLYLLVKLGYVDLETLSCPSNVHAPRTVAAGATDWPDWKAVSFSYRHQNTPATLRINVNIKSGSPLLADKNPLFTIERTEAGFVLKFREDKSRVSPSEQHGGQGQNTLVADGSVDWMPTPVLPNKDNMWLIDGISQYTGHEFPENPDDSFMP